MTERNQILISLVKEVLGPRKGPHETLPEEQDPRNEYITGVLEPFKAELDPLNMESDIDEVIEEVTGEEDQDTQGYVATPGVFSPALDPKSLPRSIGLSFTVSCDTDSPEVEVCATWARYHSGEYGWERHPAFFLTGPVNIKEEIKSWSTGAGLALQMRSRLIQPGAWRVSLFLINQIEVQPEERPDTTKYVFQPQIRVHCSPGTILQPIRANNQSTGESLESGSMAEEDLSLNLLYHHRAGLARGHMCGATWKEIDPERPFPDFPTPEEAPFAWTDRFIVPTTEQIKFSPADVRTEMVPCYPIQTPGMIWNPQYGPEPELNPEILAEVWDPTILYNALFPLVQGYRTWIDTQENLIPALPQLYQSVARSNLNKCRQVADRMAEAIDILTGPGGVAEDARLAFCFANKAIALQAHWKGQTLTWRSFQLAFILLNIPPLVNPLHPERHTCDLLWFPTGGGKTEAYLGLSAFVLALRRLQARNHDSQQEEDRTGAGTAVISRYTLRLLTIQQFRRALGMITACEYLRVLNLDQRGQRTGWRPKECKRADEFLWGGIRFSAGLWVGGGVTPNNLMSIGPIPPQPGSTNSGYAFYAGAIDILKGISPDYSGPDKDLAKDVQSARKNLHIDGEPAQVLHCPCCRAVLAIPNEGLGPGSHRLYFPFAGGRNTSINPAMITSPSRLKLVINDSHVIQSDDSARKVLSISFEVPENQSLPASKIDEWWYDTLEALLGTGARLIPVRPARPGYVILNYTNSQKNVKPYDFNIYCPNPACELNRHAWAEQVPLSVTTTKTGPSVTSSFQWGYNSTSKTNGLPSTAISTERVDWQPVPEWGRLGTDPTGERISTCIPIPAFTIDDQVYHRCPSLVIATVDKFARLPFEPKAAAIFGNVSHYHSRWGYYREGCPAVGDSNLPITYRPHPPGNSGKNGDLYVKVPPFSPPDLILQDELHLIEGPLGSMVGLYETVIDMLCQRQKGQKIIVPKYIASTATVRQAETQVKSLFNRSLMQFPPSAISADERFFAVDTEIHPLDNRKPGRLYVAVCAPGKGAQTPLVRIWSSLLQSAWDLDAGVTHANPVVDYFWTLVGYFNATRELAGALSLYRQDIPERMKNQAGPCARPCDEIQPIELSSRASSLNLPVLLQKLELPRPTALDAVFATSMFGTGVDVDRLSLMVIHGQPKTTGAYIQATGRVGRKVSGLVVSFFRASRPRDLDHYEFFTGYHRALYRYVEPITVAPFSPRARDRAIGPLAVALLRQSLEIFGYKVPLHWRIQQRLSGKYYSLAYYMRDHRHDPEVEAIPILFETRSAAQPTGRQPITDTTRTETDSELDLWQALAKKHQDSNELVYFESAAIKEPSRNVVLGDSQHHGRMEEAYDNTPQSLRDIEETTGFKV